MSKITPHHNESYLTRTNCREGHERDLTRTKCREGCASHVKICTAPQWVQSDTRKVPRGLREHMLEVYQILLHAPRKMIEKHVFRGAWHLWMRSTKCWACTKNEHEASDGLHVPCKIIMYWTRNLHKFTTVSRNKTCEPLNTLSKFTTYYACHKKWPPTAPLMSTHAFQQRFSKAATRMKTCSMSCTCHAEQGYRPQNVPKFPHLPQKRDIGHKMSTARR